MSGSRLVRGTRSRLFLYLAVVVVVGMAVYVFHGAQLQLDDARKAADKCQQQQESLSAQLQVIFEYKLRLEKSLQQEKADHRKTHEELEKRTNGEKEANNKHSALQQQYKILQSQHDDLSEDCHKMHLTQAEERSKLESQVLSLQEDLTHAQAGHKKSLNSLKTEYTKLEVENAHLEKQNAELRDQTSKTSKKLNFLEKQNFQLERDLAKATKELKTYQRHPPQTVEKASEGKQDADGSLKSPVRHSNADPSPLPASSVSSLAAAAAAAAPAPENQVNVEEPVLNQDNADNKVRSSPSSSNAPPVADKLPVMKSSSKAMVSPEQQLGKAKFAAPIIGSSSSLPAPAMLMQEAAIALPPPHASNDVNIEQLQSRIDQMLDNDKASKVPREV
ncbi:Golgi integral membrane protein 4 [Zootermopsis nevadensis]|uniref:Golgi integral membrane protein 4 n=1 Tax=Zootermopsis nevadensis TaxID=136037 RepID=A0A067QYS3_ZOONE|nr:Golgi integral membrane protein 4 [Zootermopsis nevadensis]